MQVIFKISNDYFFYSYRWRHGCKAQRNSMNLPLSLFNFISLLNFFFFPSPQFYYFPSSMFLFPPPQFLLFSLLNVFYSPPPPPPPHLFYIFFHPQIHRPPSDPTSTPHPPYIDPTLTPHRPHIDPTLNFFLTLLRK